MPSQRAYDSVELAVWSGTGNTRHVAERFAAAARDLGASTRVLPAGEIGGSCGGARRLIGFLAPTHGFTATWPSLKMAATFPGVRGTDVFVLVTRGGTRIAGRTFAGFEGTAGYLPALLLLLRGARVRGVGAVDMPLNWTTVVPAFGPENVAKIVRRGVTQVDRFSGRLLEGDAAFGGFIQLLLGILILPVSLGYMLIGRLLLAKTFFSDERCISCGTCERDCPQGAVNLRGAARRPYWTYSCENCMRCMSNCPTDAIQGGQGWLLFYIWLLTLPVGALAVGGMQDRLGSSAGWLSAAVGLMGDYLWIVAGTWLAYAILWGGLHVPGVRLALSRATFTRLYRRYRGPKG